MSDLGEQVAALQRQADSHTNTAQHQSERIEALQRQLRSVREFGGEQQKGLSLCMCMDWL